MSWSWIRPNIIYRDDRERHCSHSSSNTKKDSHSHRQTNGRIMCSVSFPVSVSVCVWCLIFSHLFCIQTYLVETRWHTLGNAYSIRSGSHCQVPNNKYTNDGHRRWAKWNKEWNGNDLAAVAVVVVVAVVIIVAALCVLCHCKFGIRDDEDKNRVQPKMLNMGQWVSSIEFMFRCCNVNLLRGRMNEWMNGQMW